MGIHVLVTNILYQIDLLRLPVMSSGQEVKGNLEAQAMKKTLGIISIPYTSQK